MFKKDFNVEKYGIENFYVTSNNSILANLQKENSNLDNNFYDNIYYPLFKGEKLLLMAIQLFYNKTKYYEIKEKRKINPNNIKLLLFGYRYCLNEISNKNNSKSIYYSFYIDNNIKYLQNNFFFQKILNLIKYIL